MNAFLISEIGTPPSGIMGRLDFNNLDYPYVYDGGVPASLFCRLSVDTLASGSLHFGVGVDDTGTPISRGYFNEYGQLHIVEFESNSGFVKSDDKGKLFSTSTITESGVIASGVLGHNDLFGLDNDDHKQYTLRSDWDQNGFPNRTDSTLSFDSVTREFSIQPTGTNFTYFLSGVQYTSTGDTVVIGNDDGPHYIQYNGDTLESIPDTSGDVENSIFNRCLVSILYWSVPQQSGIYVGEERHGLSMSPSTHLYLHDLDGLRYQEGLALVDMSVDGDGDEDIHAQFGIDAGEVHDEDIEIDIDAVGSTVGLPIYYRTGTTAFAKAINAGFSVMTGSGVGEDRLGYNQNDGGDWKITEVANNDFCLYHVFATTEYNNPMISIMGQGDYATIAAARAGANTEVNNLILNQTLAPEVRPIATIICQTSNGYANAVQGRIRTTDEGDDYVDWRSETISRVAITSDDHGTLAGLGDNDHPQYIINSGYLDQDVSVGASPIFGGPRVTDLHVENYIYHSGDINTFFNFADDQIIASVGGKFLMTMTEGADDYVHIRDQLQISNGAASTPLGILDVVTTNAPVVYIRSTAGSSNDAELHIRGARTTGSNDLAEIYFENNANDGDVVLAKIGGANADAVDVTAHGKLNFWTNPGDSGGINLAATIDEVQNLIVVGNVSGANIDQDVRTSATPQFAGIGIGTAPSYDIHQTKTYGDDSNDYGFYQAITMGGTLTANRNHYVNFCLATSDTDADGNNQALRLRWDRLDFSAGSVPGAGTKYANLREIRYASTSDPIGTMYVTYNRFRNDSTTATVPLVYTNYSEVNQDDFNGTLTTSYCYYAAQNHDSSGTSVNAYLYAGNFTGTHTVKRGLWLSNDTENHLDGSLTTVGGVFTDGSFIAQGNLDVSGSIYVDSAQKDLNWDSAYTRTGGATSRLDQPLLTSSSPAFVGQYITNYVIRTGDLDTYFGFGGSNDYRVYAGGNIGLKVDTSGVTLGNTAGATYALDVYGDVWINTGQSYRVGALQGYTGIEVASGVTFTIVGGIITNVVGG